MEKAKAVTLLVALACVVMLVVSPDGADVGLYRHSPWWHRLAYMFCHGNIIHLAFNVYALLYIVFLLPVGMRMLTFAVLSAVTVPEMLLGCIPAVGLSGVVFFLLGAILYMVKGKKHYLLTNTGVIAFGVLLPNIAWGVHAWCFSWGLIYCFAYGKRH